jgi:mannose-6-phosphate isomerase-like protein (cupin superfamily)
MVSEHNDKNKVHVEFISYYQWGDNCEGWNLVDGEKLSVKLERMPAFTAEKKHYHTNTQQYFFILKGQAVFEVDEKKITIKANQGIHILPLQKHKIINEQHMELEFILSSQPAVLSDRVNCE